MGSSWQPKTWAAMVTGTSCSTFGTAMSGCATRSWIIRKRFHEPGKAAMPTIKVMAERPTPVVICSTLTAKGTETAMQALSAGAFSIMTKPKIGIKDFLLDASADLVALVKAAGKANVQNLLRDRPAASKSSPKL